MAWTIEFRPSSLKELRRLPAKARERIAAAIDDLGREPRPPGVKALRGELCGLWRIRIGDYRVIYTIDDDVLVIVVVKVSHRRDAYE